ncbi:TolB family protein [Paludisphaera rhizosphaerae]|uniref:TolB family protein n=1 Tax=Paludisphaera rhizosphaerae TaxID=2711216 RepID=UPI0013EA2B8C|nr:PD40 domain-containing protein [Paludisphaera rhizosphaerae]
MSTKLRISILAAALMLTVRGAAGDGPKEDGAPAVKLEQVGPQVTGAVDRMAERLKQGPVEQTPVADRSALFLLDVDKGEVTLIADEPDPGRKYCGSPRWSSDGRRILFDSSPGMVWSKTRLKSIDLTDDRLKVADLGLGNCPSFSPDGKRIAYLVNHGAAPDLKYGVWTMQSDGSDRRRHEVFGIPKWSPDGKQLLIVRFGSPVEMSLMDVESDQVQPIRLPGYKIHSSPSWAGPGTLVAVASSDEGAAVVFLDVTNPSEAKIKEILWKKGDRLDGNPSYPIYSPVTGRCVFVSREPQGMALYSIQRGTFGPPKRLEAQGFDNKIASLEFSPDGRYVLFCSDRLDRRAHAAVGSTLAPIRPTIRTPSTSGRAVEGLVELIR